MPYTFANWCQTVMPSDLVEFEFWKNQSSNKDSTGRPNPALINKYINNYTKNISHIWEEVYVVAKVY